MVYVIALAVLALMGIVFVLLRVLWRLAHMERDRDVHQAYLHQELKSRGMLNQFKEVSDAAFMQQALAESATRPK